MKLFSLTLSVLVLTMLVTVELRAQKPGKPNRGGLSGLDNKLDRSDEPKPARPADPVKPKIDKTTKRKIAPMAHPTGADKRIAQLEAEIKQLDDKNKIAVKIKTLKDAKRTLNRYIDRFVSPTSKSASKSENLRRQFKRLRMAIGMAQIEIDAMQKKAREGKFQQGGAKERLAVRESELNRLLFEVYRQGKRMELLTELLAEKWARDYSFPKIKITVISPFTFSMSYKETAPKPPKTQVGHQGEAGRIREDVEQQLDNANQWDGQLTASFKSTLEAKPYFELQTNRWVIDYRVTGRPFPTIDHRIANANKTQLQAEVFALFGPGRLGSPQGRPDYQCQLTADELYELRMNGILTIYLSSSRPFNNLRLWQLDTRPKLVLKATLAGSKPAKKNAGSQPNGSQTDDGQNQQ